MRGAVAAAGGEGDERPVRIGISLRHDGGAVRREAGVPDFGERDAAAFLPEFQLGAEAGRATRIVDDELDHVRAFHEVGAVIDVAPYGEAGSGDEHAVDEEIAVVIGSDAALEADVGATGVEGDAVGVPARRTLVEDAGRNPGRGGGGLDPRAEENRELIGITHDHRDRAAGRVDVDPHLFLRAGREQAAVSVRRAGVQHAGQRRRTGIGDTAARRRGDDEVHRAGRGAAVPVGQRDGDGVSAGAVLRAGRGRLRANDRAGAVLLR